jgi:hypothetical protein
MDSASVQSSGWGTTFRVGSRKFHGRFTPRATHRAPSLMLLPCSDREVTERARPAGGIHLTIHTSRGDALELENRAKAHLSGQDEAPAGRAAREGRRP